MLIVSPFFLNSYELGSPLSRVGRLPVSRRSLSSLRRRYPRYWIQERGFEALHAFYGFVVSLALFQLSQLTDLSASSFTATSWGAPTPRESLRPLLAKLLVNLEP